MKQPKTIKALAIVEGNNPKLDVYEIYSIKNGEFVLAKGEKICEVEIKFVKYVKK